MLQSLGVLNYLFLLKNKKERKKNLSLSKTSSSFFFILTLPKSESVSILEDILFSLKIDVKKDFSV